MTETVGAVQRDPRVTPVVCDACVFINLWATGELEAIVRANRMRLLLVEQVATEVRLQPGSTQLIVGEPRAGADLVQRSVLEVVGLANGDLGLYVDLAKDLDDGEAASLAYSFNRQLSLLTDERKAIRIIGERFPSVTVLRTAALLRAWAGAGGNPDIVAALRAVEEDASFIPNASDPDRAWWMATRRHRH